MQKTIFIVWHVDFLGDPIEIEKFLVSLAEDVSEELQKDGRNLRAKTVTVKLKKSNFEVLTRAFTCPRYINRKEELIEFAMPLLRKEFPCELRLLGLKVSNFQNAAEDLPQGQKRLTSFFQKGNGASSRVPPRPLQVQNSTSSNLNTRAGGNLKENSNLTPAKRQKLDQFFTKKPNSSSKNKRDDQVQAKKIISPRHLGGISIDVVSDSEGEQLGESRDRSSKRNLEPAVEEGCLPGGKDVVNEEVDQDVELDFDDGKFDPECCGSSQGSWVDMLTQSASYNTQRRMSITSQDGVTMFGNTHSQDEDRELAQQYQAALQTQSGPPDILDANERGDAGVRVESEVEGQVQHAVVESFVTADEPNSDSEPYKFHFADAHDGLEQPSHNSNERQQNLDDFAGDVDDAASEGSWVEPPPTQVQVFPQSVHLAEGEVHDQPQENLQSQHLIDQQLQQREVENNSNVTEARVEEVHVEERIEKKSPRGVSAAESDDVMVIQSQDAIVNEATPRKMASDRKKLEDGLISPATNIKIKYESIPLADESDGGDGGKFGDGGRDFTIDEFKSPRSRNSFQAGETSPSVAVLSDGDTPFKHSSGGGGSSVLVPGGIRSVSALTGVPRSVVAPSSISTMVRSSGNNIMSMFGKPSRRGSTNSTISNQSSNANVRCSPWTCEKCEFRHLRLFEANSPICTSCDAPRPKSAKGTAGMGFSTQNAALELARAKSGKRPRSPSHGVTQKITRFLSKHPKLKKNLKNISGAYMSPGSGCVDKKHFVGYVELVFGCLS